MPFDKDYFMRAQPNIADNNQLRDPQILGYNAVFNHFNVKNKKTHAIVVLPTGVGKTGLMGIIPFHICKGKVLIITPQLTIKDTVIDSLDPTDPESFWKKRNIFNNDKEMPTLIEYDNSTTDEILELANIVVLNIHKLQTRLENSPINNLAKDYFDMIIIDEAHHSTAATWVAAIEHFSNAKVVKLTGTPIRTDGVEMAGELVYKYKLSQAMANGYVKSLKNIQYIPDELLLTIDNEEATTYTVEQIVEKRIRDEEWISRSVAYSRECSNKVVEASVEKLKKKKRGSTAPHKIIAVACSIKHAEQIKELYLEAGVKAEVIHSRQEEHKKNSIKKSIENHQIDAIINVSMLGEGYDHPYLSIAAIFKPFRSTLPYEQFIGRVLRIIPEDEVSKADDNIADIISHERLALEHLWEKYKIEIQESDIIKHLQDVNIVDDNDDNVPSSDTRVLSMGVASEKGRGKLTEDPYIDTEIIRRHEEEKEKQASDIRKLQELLNISKEDALTIYNQSKTQENAAMKRPDEFFKNQRKSIDAEIKEDIIPNIIVKYEIKQEDNYLRGCRLFTGKYSWIIKNESNNNGALLAMYFNDYLRHKIGKKRRDWTMSDYEIAREKLSIAREYVEEIVASYIKNL